MAPYDYVRSHLPIATTLAACLGVTWYIGVELNIRIFMTFKRRRGLYFWSLLVCSWGLMLNQVFGGIWVFGVAKNPWIVAPGIYLTWASMVNGQSLILYSRLDLVMGNRTHLRWILAMIVVTAVGISLPAVIIGLVVINNPIKIMDRIQVVSFFVQEMILSALYVYWTRKYLKDSLILGNENRRVRNVIKHLLYVNLLIIFLDITILVLSFMPGDMFYVQASLKPVVYGVKCRLEFSILNRLVKTVNRNGRYSNGSSDRWSDQMLVGTPWSQTAWTPRRPSFARGESFGCRPKSDGISRSPVIEGGAGFADLGIGTERNVSLEVDGIVQTTQISIAPVSKGISEVTKTVEKV